MISVMNDREFDRKSASSADLFFFGMENPPEEGTGASGRSPPGDDFNKARVLDFDMEDRVSENSWKDFPGSRESLSAGAEAQADGARVSESEAGREGSAVVKAAEGSGSLYEAAPSWMNGFKVSDMVWGKVKSHPWWPGHIFNEALASLSVRRMKREGHVLVAFFGDSSYGWFDPAELIPFDPNFLEKSRQTNSRNFIKAVEEAVDEASRRGALALACHCRNPNNFRPTDVPGYFLVDVAGFESGGIYSLEQIENARDSFVPAEALSLVHQLAVMPQMNESSKSVDWISKMATILAYRRAVFEEFDETYAQAFGVQPVRPSKNDSGVRDQPTRAAPLSGPLVIAEALSKKSSTKSTTRSSSSSKKNEYLLKRRDETPTTSPPLPDFRPDTHPHGGATGGDYYFNLAPGQQPQASVVISSLPAFREAAATAVPGSNSADASQLDNYVLQKRAPTEKPQPALATQEDSKAGGYEVATGSAQKQRVTELVSMMAATDAHGSGSIPHFPTTHLPPTVWEDFDDCILKSQQPPQACTVRPIVDLDAWKSPVKVEPTIGAIDTTSVSRHEEKPSATDLTDGAGLNMPTAVDSTQPKLEAPSLAKDRAAEGVTEAVPVDFGPPPAKSREAKMIVDGVVKEKVRKRSPNDETGDFKKKKKKRDETGTILRGTPKDREPRRKAAGKSIGIRLGNAELVQTELPSEHAEVGRTVSPPKLDLDTPDLELPQFLTGLSALALDPFHGIERNAPDVIRHVFLRFRSMVYQKSLVFPPASENDEPMVQATKPAYRSLQVPKTSDIISVMDVKELVEPKPSKPTSRPDDPTKAGRKRGPSDRQEELSTKRLKKLNKLKALASEKKARISQKAPEGQQRDQKDVTAAAQVKSNVAAETIKKLMPPPPPKVSAPTFLVMKFPPRTTLPSISSLKARFGRFGLLDLSGTRVYWKSYSCKVLFKYKPDAEAAYNHIRSNAIFGQVKVNCYLRELEAPVTEPPSDAGKWRTESCPDDGPQFRPGNGNGGLPRSALYQQQQRQSLVQLKSILKKPGDDALPPGGGIVKEVSRVKFMLGGDDGRREPPVVVDSNNSGGSGVDVASSSPLPPSEPISKNPKSVNLLQLPPPPPPPVSRPLMSLHPFLSQQPSRVSDRHRFPPVSTTSVSLLQPSHLRDMPPSMPPIPLPLPSMPPFPLPPGHPPSMPQLLQPLPVSLPLPPLPPPCVVDGFQNRGPAPFSDAQPLRAADNGEAETRESSKADISHQMLSLLLRCSNIVTNVKSSFGYVPYRPV